MPPAWRALQSALAGVTSKVSVTWTAISAGGWQVTAILAV